MTVSIPFFGVMTVIIPDFGLRTVDVLVLARQGLFTVGILFFGWGVFLGGCASKKGKSTVQRTYLVF